MLEQEELLSGWLPRMRAKGSNKAAGGWGCGSFLTAGGRQIGGRGERNEAAAGRGSSKAAVGQSRAAPSAAEEGTRVEWGQGEGGRGNEGGTDWDKSKAAAGGALSSPVVPGLGSISTLYVSPPAVWVPRRSRRGCW